MLLFLKGIEIGAELIAWGLTKGAEVGSHLMHKVSFTVTFHVIVCSRGPHGQEGEIQFPETIAREATFTNFKFSNFLFLPSCACHLRSLFDDSKF